MQALTWQGRRDVRVEQVPDPRIEHPRDAIIEVTSSGLCGSDLHLYEPLGAFLHPGDILGHEAMGTVVETGSEVPHLNAGDRVVVPFQISCGSCFMCDRGLHTQCETTQVRKHGMGAQLFGYTDLYGAVPGAQAEYLRVPHADFGPLRIDSDRPDDRFVFLSDVVPTAWQSVEYSGIQPGETLLVVGLGPIGEMAARIALTRQIQVIGVDRVPARLRRSAELGVEVLDLSDGDVADRVRELTAGRGADAVIDAVGMEAHGAPVAEAAQKMTGLLPDKLARPLMKTVSVDRLSALTLAIHAARRGATISLAGVYAGAMDPLPMQIIFDKQLTLRTGQANVRRWLDDILPVVLDDADPLGLEQFATHRMPLAQAPEAYATFQSKGDDMIKTVFTP